MKKLGLLFLVLAVATLGGTALAQGDNTDYFVTYFANNVSAAPDATVRIINDGENSVNDENTLWASLYIFDDSQELTECCSCPITGDGLLSESVRNELTNTPLTGIKPARGVIKLISSTVNAGGPGSHENPTSNFTNSPAPGLRPWATHIQSNRNQYPYGPAPYSQTETLFADSNLSAGEELMLEQLCKFDHLLSGRNCYCTFEDYDF
jgi:hypothetical protein